jgi:hypothetical protein
MTRIQWFGHAAHFICGHRCRFHLATKVGRYLVSTVGELPKFNPSDPDSLGPFETIGAGRMYETMVFKAGAPCKAKDCGCGLPTIDGSELDFAPYNDAGSATAGHMKIVAKWRRKK